MPVEATFAPFEGFSSLSFTSEEPRPVARITDDAWNPVDTQELRYGIKKQSLSFSPELKWQNIFKTGRKR
jgi:hypothetical protein